MSIINEAKADLRLLQQQGLYRKRRPVQGAQGPLVHIDGKQLINFSSNDYLGLANDGRLKDWMVEAIEEYGTGSGASQLIVGHSVIHQALEEKLAQFLRRERALVFPTGYMANLAIASTLIDKKTLIIQDRLNHASLIDAALLSPGRLLRYKHNDLEGLKSLLENYREINKVVMTDGVFSMDGDCADLSEIAALCNRYNALLIVDDAHGVGVFGETGAGLLEVLALEQRQVPLLIGTFGKAFGLSGAFVAGDKTLIELMVQKARTYIYTTALAPAVAATLVNTISLVSGAKALRQSIKNNIKQLKSAVQTSLVSDTHIQPVVIGDAMAAVRCSDRLYEDGLLALAIRPPTVREGTSRLRISVSAAHTAEHISKLANALNTNLP